MTTVINFKTDSRVKSQAQKVAEAMGLNLSDILNIYLRGFVRRKELHISLNGDESRPSKELLEAVIGAKEERRRGRLKGFENIDALISHLGEV